MQRRQFLIGAAGVALFAALPALAARENEYGGIALRRAVAALERRSGGRLGVVVRDVAARRSFAWRGAGRFPMCSTFKFLLAAAILARVDRGRETLDRRIAVPAGAQLSNSPFSESRAGRDATIGQLCEAIMVDSDNAAANLLLPAVGGTAGVTRFARALGDPLTRLDRQETAMGESAPGDPRDTTAPASMVGNLQRLLLGDVLRPESRARLTAWMIACRTGRTRLRAGLPGGWRVGDKTGSGTHGTVNDIAIAWPAADRPILIAAYLTGSTLEERPRHAILADLGRAVAAGLSPAA